VAEVKDVLQRAVVRALERGNERDPVIGGRGGVLDRSTCVESRICTVFDAVTIRPVWTNRATGVASRRNGMKALTRKNLFAKVTVKSPWEVRATVHPLPLLLAEAGLEVPFVAKFPTNRPTSFDWSTRLKGNALRSISRPPARD
jgi:hypothetical protein